MRNILALFLVSALASSSSLVSGQQKPLWTVVSAGDTDPRIERQLHEMATRRRAALRFSHDAAQSLRPSPGNLLLVLDAKLDATGDGATFLSALKREAGGSAVEPTAALASEGYILRAFYSNRPAPDRIQIQAPSAIGLHNALLRLPDMLATAPANLATDLIPQPQFLRVENNGTEVVIADYPSFPIRGIVEGFYGPPWSHADRVDMLRFEGQHGMNLFLYGPKDDPYHRRLWREPYPPDQMKRLESLAAVAEENFVDFSFAISPGLSMIYSSEAEFQTLARKLEDVSKLGISNFALFLDDVPQDLVHPEDRARFKNLAQAHIYLINRLSDHLKSLSPHNRLTVCPTTYTNEWGNRDYIRELGAGVNPEIPLDWTGTEVVPAQITVAQAEEWGRQMHRRPLIWDNYPTNDGGAWRLNLDSLRRRESGLFAATQGLISNPMYQAHATMIPLQTVADYLWNPVAYDPEKSQVHAIRSQYGQDAMPLLAPLLQIFADRHGPRMIFGSMFDERWSSIDIPAIESQIAHLSSVINAFQNQPRFEKLAREIAPIPGLLRAQLKRVSSDAGFKHLPGGKIQWDRDRDLLVASRFSVLPALDGDFAKWESRRPYLLNRTSQIVDGVDLWKGPSQFSARVALAWDADNLYFGVDVIDPQLYQPFSGRGIQNADAFRLIVDTIVPIAVKPGRPSSVFDFYLSPGDFAAVAPSVYSNEDFFPLRSRPHNYSQEIRAVWKKTAFGYSGDISVPAALFERANFSQGQEIGLSFGAQKVFPPKDPFAEDLAQIVFSSKESRLFPVEPESPATLQRLLLQDDSASK